MKRSIKSWLAGLAAAGLLCMPAAAVAEPLGTELTACAFWQEEPVTYALETTIYFYDPTDKIDLPVPDDLPRSFQLPLPEGAASHADMYYETSMELDENGVVSPKKSLQYDSVSGERREMYSEGSYEIFAITPDGEQLYYLIHVEDYTSTAVYSYMDKYIEEHFTNTMTDMEKLQGICEFVTSYRYSKYYSDMVSMVASGVGGDCWASADTVNYMARKLGFQSRTHVPSVGASHRDNLVCTESGLYIVDATPEFTIEIKKCDDVFSTSLLSDGTLMLKEYRGFDQEVTVPAQIDGKPVTVIAKEAFSRSDPDNQITAIYLPDTITTIETKAFSNMTALRELCIPASVSSMSMDAFGLCRNLKLEIAPDSPYYKLADGILYSGDGKHLIRAMEFDETDKSSYFTKYIKKTFRVPEGVEYIDNQAFYNSKSLSSITFPETLKEIGSGAFMYSGLEGSIILPASLESIGWMAFCDCYCSAFVFLGDDCVIQDEPEDGGTLGGNSANAGLLIVGNPGSTAEAYAEEYKTGLLKVSTSDGIETYEYCRYRFCPYPAGEETVVDSDTLPNGSWAMVWSKKTGMTLRITADGAVDTPQKWGYFGLSNTLVLSDGVTSIGSDFQRWLSGVRTVYGTAGSYAEKYAASKGCAFISTGAPLAGDCNGDGRVQIADAVLLQKWLLGVPKTTLTASALADLNGDGVTDVFDLALLKRQLMQK